LEEQGQVVPRRGVLWCQHSHVAQAAFGGVGIAAFLKPHVAEYHARLQRMGMRSDHLAAQGFGRVELPPGQVG
jgi:hypothetical protein